MTYTSWKKWSTSLCVLVTGSWSNQAEVFNGSPAKVRHIYVVFKKNLTKWTTIRQHFMQASFIIIHANPYLLMPVIILIQL